MDQLITCIVAALQRERLMYISETYTVFKTISKKRQHQLSTICRIARFKPGTTIVEKDDAKHTGRFYIVAGAVPASVFLGDTLVREIKEGDYFGEVGLVSNQPPTATVKGNH